MYLTNDDLQLVEDAGWLLFAFLIWCFLSWVGPKGGKRG